MTTCRTIPAGARLVETVYATNGTESIVVRRYEGTASDGYKTSYTARPAAWIGYTSTSNSWVRRFTGRNLAGLSRDWAAALEALRAEGWTVETRRA